ncbi:MAG: hypothetical protein U5N26_08615 [Candidatus Marinimicrobia bacterium]|nr:hypothetical protein [Candidatus Neomarinimicrobiota bacterium]
MKTITLTFDHLHFSAELNSDKGLLKNLHFDIQKPDETIVITMKAPIVNTLKVELDFVHFRNDILTLHILSHRKIAEMLINFLERYTHSIPFVRVDYPDLRIDTRMLSKLYFPKHQIRHIAVANKQYIIETEIT